MPLPSEYVRKTDPVVPAKPWVTVLLLLGCLWMFYESSTHGQTLLWLKYHSFIPAKLSLYMHQGKFVDLITYMLSPTFVQLNMWHLIGNCYFLWVFGSLVELRLGFGRFLFIVLMGIYGGWALQAYDAGYASYSLFNSPALLTTCIIGAYMCFFPEKQISPGGTIGRSTRFYKNEPDPNPADAFGVSPWTIVAAFIAYQVIMNWVMSSLTVHFETMRLVAACGAFVMGLIACALMVAAAAGGKVNNPLQTMAVKRYQQLRALDLSHDEALEGTARLMCVPSEQVKQWITKGGGPLPQAPT